jgi:hypothetical protein
VTGERERPSDDLGQSHALLRAVVEGVTDAIFVKDREGSISNLTRGAVPKCGHACSLDARRAMPASTLPFPAMD